MNDSSIVDDGGDGTPRWLPSPEEIRAECRLIQATWSPAEEVKRRCFENKSPDYGRPARFGELADA